MNQAITRLLILAIATLPLAACAGPDRLNLRVLDAATGQPVQGALIRAIVLDASPIPFPITKETIAEFRFVPGEPTLKLTDANGEATLIILSDRPALIELAPQTINFSPDLPTGEPARPNLSFILNPGATSLIPLHDPKNTPKPLYRIILLSR